MRSRFHQLAVGSVAVVAVLILPAMILGQEYVPSEDAVADKYSKQQYSPYVGRLF